MKHTTIDPVSDRSVEVVSKLPCSSLRTVYRFALVNRLDDSGLWRVRNISDRLISLESSTAVEVGERLVIRMSEAIELFGAVIWVGQGTCCVRWNHRINSHDILRRLVLEQESGLYRPMRVPVCTIGKMKCEGQDIDIRVNSISRHGVGFEQLQDGITKIGSEVDIALGDRIWRRGIVCWLRGDKGGLRLLLPMPAQSLESSMALSGFA